MPSTMVTRNSNYKCEINIENLFCTVQHPLREKKQQQHETVKWLYVLSFSLRPFDGHNDEFSQLIVKRKEIKKQNT